MKKPVKKPKKTVAASKAKKPEPKKPAAKPAPVKAKAKTPEKKPLVKASPEKAKAPAPVVTKKAAPAAAAPAPAKKEEPKKPAPKIEAKDAKDIKKETPEKTVVSKKTEAPKSASGAGNTVVKGASKAAPSPIKVEPKIIETSQVEYVKPNLEEQLFTEDELRAFRELLDVERGKILVKARKAMEEGNMQFAKDDMMDEVDQASAMIEQNLTFRLLDRDRKLLSEIDHAIAKLDTGEYGYCEGTGEAIPKRRLELRPWCRHSVKYKEKLERMKKSGRGVVDEDEM